MIEGKKLNLITIILDEIYLSANESLTNLNNLNDKNRNGEITVKNISSSHVINIINKKIKKFDKELKINLPNHINDLLIEGEINIARTLKEVKKINRLYVSKNETEKKMFKIDSNIKEIHFFTDKQYFTGAKIEDKLLNLNYFPSSMIILEYCAISLSCSTNTNTVSRKGIFFEHNTFDKFNISIKGKATFFNLPNKIEKIKINSKLNLKKIKIPHVTKIIILSCLSFFPYDIDRKIINNIIHQHSINIHYNYPTKISMDDAIYNLKSIISYSDKILSHNNDNLEYYKNKLNTEMLNEKNTENIKKLNNTISKIKKNINDNKI